MLIDKTQMPVLPNLIYTTLNHSHNPGKLQGGHEQTDSEDSPVQTLQKCSGCQRLNVQGGEFETNKWKIAFLGF